MSDDGAQRTFSAAWLESQRLSTASNARPPKPNGCNPHATGAGCSCICASLCVLTELCAGVCCAALRLCVCAQSATHGLCGPVRACAGAARASGGALSLRRCAGGAVSAVIRQQCALKCLTGRSCSRALHSAATVRGKWCKCIAAHSRMQGSDGSDSSSISSTSKPSRRRGRPQPQAQAQLSLMLMLSSRLCCSDTDSVRWALLGLTSTPPPFHR